MRIVELLRMENWQKNVSYVASCDDILMSNIAEGFERIHVWQKIQFCNGLWSLSVRS